MEVIYETRLLGVIITSNLSWAAHVDDMTKRATQKLWVLLRFKALGGTTDQLVTVYQTRVRSTLEFAAPVFHSGLTQEQSRQIEMVKKKACKKNSRKNKNPFFKILINIYLSDYSSHKFICLTISEGFIKQIYLQTIGGKILES